MSLYGSARVSTLEQDLTLQRGALKAAGYDVIRAAKARGVYKGRRPGISRASVYRVLGKPET